jgi:uncharacterized protein YgiM (DUF1202 family)
MAKVISDYKVVHADAITAAKGDPVLIQRRETKAEWLGWIWCTLKGGKSGWISENYLEIGVNTGSLIKDYDGREVPLFIGEEVEVLEVDSGWAWVKKPDKTEGWVPLENLSI